MTESPPILKTTLTVVAEAAVEETRTEGQRGHEAEHAQRLPAVLFHDSHTLAPGPSTTKGWRSQITPFPLISRPFCSRAILPTRAGSIKTTGSMKRMRKG